MFGIQQIRIKTNDTLKEIGASDVPILYVYNKSDKAKSRSRTRFNTNANVHNINQEESKKQKIIKKLVFDAFRKKKY